MSSFAMAPRDGPPRLYRYYPGGEEAPTAILDSTHNLLFINEYKFDQLTPIEQHILIRTTSKITP